MTPTNRHTHGQNAQHARRNAQQSRDAARRKLIAQHAALAEQRARNRRRSDTEQPTSDTTNPAAHSTPAGTTNERPKRSPKRPLDRTRNSPRTPRPRPERRLYGLRLHNTATTDK
nr:gas vesicle protein gvpI [imported] - Halobacterium salinarum [Halobacterium salinarum]CAA45988.1 c-gvpI [Halobacterium salinarum]CAA64348.1 gvpI [Halobacterium salinarum]